jgi:hypothetical protein
MTDCNCVARHQVGLKEKETALDIPHVRNRACRTLNSLQHIMQMLKEHDVSRVHHSHLHATTVRAVE